MVSSFLSLRAIAYLLVRRQVAAVALCLTDGAEDISVCSSDSRLVSSVDFYLKLVRIGCIWSWFWDHNQLTRLLICINDGASGYFSKKTESVQPSCGIYLLNRNGFLGDQQHLSVQK